MKPANATGSSPSPPLEERAGERRPSPWSWWMGIAVSLVTFGSLVGAVLSSAILKQSTPRPPTVTVKEIGATLMERYVLPLEVIGLLLTAAMVGAALIAMREKNPSAVWTHEASERVSSLSSPGGEGRGEEAVSSGRRDRL